MVPVARPPRETWLQDLGEYSLSVVRRGEHLRFYESIALIACLFVDTRLFRLRQHLVDVVADRLQQL